MSFFGRDGQAFMDMVRQGKALFKSDQLVPYMGGAANIRINIGNKTRTKTTRKRKSTKKNYKVSMKKRKSTRKVSIRKRKKISNRRKQIYKRRKTYK